MRTDRILVIDVESTCWSEGTKPEWERSEIIEIGMAWIVWGDGGSTVYSENPKSLLVKPTISKVSQFCHDLTGLSQKDVDDGMTMRNACEFIQDRGSRDVVWASWGGYDSRKFEEDLKLQGIRSPFSGHHLDIKSMFSAMRGEWGGGLSKAVQKMDITFVGRPHSGGDDALMAAITLHKLIGERPRIVV